MIHLVSDSTCDMAQEERQEMQVHVVPITITFGDESYQDGVTISQEAFYKKLEQSEQLPTTAAPSPLLFEEMFRELIKGEDEVIVVTMGGTFSATLQSALIAQKDVSMDRIHVVDSTNGSAGASLLIRAAHQMRSENRYTARQIADKLRELAPRIQLYALLDTMKYLLRSGRVGRGVAIVGKVLSIKPIMKVENNTIGSAGLTRGEMGGLNALRRFIRDHKPDFSYGIAFFTGNMPERMEKLIDFIKPDIGDAPIFRSAFSGAVGTNTGPGVVGIAFIAS